MDALGLPGAPMVVTQNEKSLEESPPEGKGSGLEVACHPAPPASAPAVALPPPPPPHTAHLSLKVAFGAKSELKGLKLPF